MIKYIIKRLALSVIILLGVSLIIYTLVRLKPGLDFIETLYQPKLRDDTTGEIYEKMQQQREVYGLTSPIFEGYLKWLSNVLQGDWGDSFKHSVPDGEEILYTIDPATGEKTPIIIDGVVQKRTVATSSTIKIIIAKSKISFIIALFATIFQFAIAVPLGILSATKQYGVLDYTVTILAMMGISLPSFFFGALLLRIFSLKLGWFPYAGLTDPNSNLPFFLDALHHLVLPMTVLVILSIGGLMRYTRTNMLEVLNADYIRTARAKGLSERKVIYKHAFRNTMIPIVTLLAGILPGLFGGAMITETIFSIDGIGKVAYEAVVLGDIPLVMTYNVFISILTVVGILFSDIMYAVVDPRVKLTSGGK